MSRHPVFYHWHDTIANRFPHLSKPQLLGLALWSFGMILARRSGLSSVSLFLARFLGQATNTLRQRLREFYKDAPHKTGANHGRKRSDFEVSDCFVLLLAWILSFWTCKRLVLVLDPTNLGERFHVLCVSVVYRGLAIPVAWKILPGNTPGAWNPHWKDLLGRLHATLGTDWEVLVLTDRGLESPDLFRQITTLGWHPLMRVKQGGTFRPQGWHKFYRFGNFAGRIGAKFADRGQAYKSIQEPLECTLLALWETGYEEPWLILTDLQPRSANPCWYAYRAWIEQGFKVIKSGGWQWQRTRMTDPRRAERLWLAMAITTLWVVALSGETDEKIAVETVGKLVKASAGPLQEEQGAPKRVRKVKRLHRVFVQGLAVLVAVLLKRSEVPLWRLEPEDWPEPWHDAPTITEAQLCLEKVYP